MIASHYALVSYVKGELGNFVEDLRRELYPKAPDFPAHVTLLPPRHLAGSEADAEQLLTRICAHSEPFEVILGEVETFIPVTPTVFIRVAKYAYKMRELHDRLNTGALFFDEPWPYMPHMTIAKMPEMVDAMGASEIARRRWAQYMGSRRIIVEQVTFVREGDDQRWIDLAPIPLGGRLVSK